MKEEHIAQVVSAVEAVREKLQNGGVQHIFFVACGGSQASMMPAQYIFDRTLSIPASIYTSNEFNYGTPKGFNSSSVVITCSHSGATPETVTAAQKASDAGAISIAFSNVVDSPLWKASTHPIHYDHGEGAEDCDKGGSVMLCLWFRLLALLDSEHAAQWQAGDKAIDGLAAVKETASNLYRDKLLAWANTNKRAKIIYTMGSGAPYGEMYSLSACFFMEMQWLHSGCIHTGEYFHGPFEVTDYDVPFVIALSNGATRHLDERAYAFVQKYSDHVLAIDEKDFDFSMLGTFSSDVEELLATEVLGAVVRVMVDALAHDRGHALSVRRYMWQMEY